MMTKMSTRKPSRGSTRARKVARWGAFAGLLTLFATPAVAQYSWSLGDLSSSSSRFDVNWDNDDWADAYDSEAELNALGWSTVNVTAGINCAAGGPDSAQDQAALQSYFRNTAYCSQPSGDTPGVCNKVFKLQANCTYDVLAGEDGSINGTPALQIQYSNFALVGADPRTSFISANNTVTSNTTQVAPLLSTGSGWGYTGGPDGASYAWGGSSNRGQNALTINGSCAGLAAGDLVQVIGTDGDGAPLDYRTRITNTPSASNCTINISDPLPTTFAGRTSIVEKGQNGPKRMIFLNFKAGFPFLPAGVGTNAPDMSNALVVRMRAVQESLFQNVTLGPYGQMAIDSQGNWRYVVRHSTLGPGLHTMRRQNNAMVISRNVQGSLVSFYDNAMLQGATRLYLNDGSTQFGYFGFNYHVPQLPTDSREGGNYCTGITNPQGFPNVSAGPERSMFLNHDPAVANNVGHVLIEANDFKCQVVNEGLNPTRRYTTFYRNRILNHGFTSFEFRATAINESYLNIVANRAYSFSFNGDATMPNALGRFNTAVQSINAPGGTGVSWPTSGAGRNYVDSGAHDDYAATNLPPSLAIRTSTPPSWWCQESGPWDGSWSFGYGDGADNGGSPRKLPAQIRLEGGTCTPPSGTVTPLSPPVFLE